MLGATRLAQPAPLWEQIIELTQIRALEFWYLEIVGHQRIPQRFQIDLGTWR